MTVLRIFDLKVKLVVLAVTSDTEGVFVCRCF